MHKRQIYLSESRVCFGLPAFTVHHVQQTKSAPASSVHKQTAAQGSVHWVWSKSTSKPLVLASCVPHPYSDTSTCGCHCLFCTPHVCALKDQC